MSQFPSTDQPGYTPNPFAAGPPGYQPPRKSRWWLWVLIGLGGVGALMCCGCAGMMWFGMSAAGGILETQMISRLNDDEKAKEHLGTVTSAKWDMMASSKATQDKGSSVSILVFHAEGDKGKGDVHAEQAPGEKMFQNARLILAGGDEVELGF